MNFLSIDGSLKSIIFYVKNNNKSFSETFQSNKYNYENFSSLLINFLERNKVKLENLEKIFVCQGPGNFSSLRTSIAIAKGIGISKNIEIFGYNNFLLAGSKYFKKKFVLIIPKKENFFFVKEFEKNLKTQVVPQTKSLEEIINCKKKALVLVDYNLDKNNNFELLSKTNNIDIITIDYENIIFLYNKKLTTKKLIKPLYLS